MTTWFSLPLGDGMFAFEPKEALREQTHRAFEDADRPAHFAVFTRHELEGRLQCEVIAYFTPEAADLARSQGAKSCAPPSGQDMDWMAGDPAAAAHYFSHSP